MRVIFHIVSSCVCLCVCTYAFCIWALYIFRWRNVSTVLIRFCFFFVSTACKMTGHRACIIRGQVGLQTLYRVWYYMAVIFVRFSVRLWIVQCFQDLWWHRGCISAAAWLHYVTFLPVNIWHDICCIPSTCSVQWCRILYWNKEMLVVFIHDIFVPYVALGPCNTVHTYLAGYI